MRFAILSVELMCLLSVTACTESGSRSSSSPFRGAAETDSTSVTILDVDGMTARIVRDEYGIPHIFAPTNRAVFVAYGFAIAEDRLWQLETFRRSGRGTLAEILGPTYVTADKYSRLLGYTDSELDAQFNRLTAEEQSLFNAYIEGINRYIVDVVTPDPANKLPLEFQLGVGIPHLYTTRDLVSFLVVVVRQFGEIGGNELNNQALLRDLIAQHGEEQGYGIFNDLHWLNDEESPATIPVPARRSRPSVGERRSPAVVNQLRGEGDTSFEALRRQALSLWEKLGIPTRLGSYAWAVGPEKSVNGRAMLYGGPQMGFNVPEIIHEVDLNSEEDLHAIGLAVAGGPGVIIGHNQNVAWSLTTGAAGDNLDVYAETLCQGGTTYLYLGECLEFQRRLEVIQVAGGQPVEYEVLRTIHGPVIAMQPDLAFSQKRAHWMNELPTVSAFSGFDRAVNLTEFQAQVDRATLSFNVMYADRQGNIAYFLAGLNPVRPPGYDLRLPFPGNGSAEWTAELRSNPFVINPARGWLANWNNKPTVDYASGDGDTFGKIYRANDLFARFAQGTISEDDMEDIPKDIARVKGRTGRESRFLKAYLLDALDAVPPSDPVANAARAVVKDWEGSAFIDALDSTTLQAGEIIFSAWLTRMLNNTFGEVLGTHRGEASSNLLVHALDFAFTGTSGVPPSRDYFVGQDPNALMSIAFDQIVAELAAAQGNDPTSWTAPRGTIVFRHPLAGEVGVIPLSNRSTYGQVVVLDSPIRGKNIFTLGQSGFIQFIPPDVHLDPHFRDLLPLYRNFQYKRMGIDRDP